VIAWWVATLFTSQLFGLSARDPLTIGVAVACLAGVLLVATWLPAQWGVRLSPLSALRQVLINSFHYQPRDARKKNL